MKKIRVIAFALIFCLHYDGFGQIPIITVLQSDVSIDSVSPHIFNGLFRVDSIFDIGDAYLITVVSVDSIETNSREMSILTATGVPFTIISFKYGEMTGGMKIHTGLTYYFTLSPPDGIWTLFGDKNDDWRYYQTVKKSTGDIIKVPLPLIKTQLMISSELNGLQYYCNSQTPVSTKKQQDCSKDGRETSQ